LHKKLYDSRLSRVDRDMSTSIGPGNVITLFLEFQHVTEVPTAFGARNVPGVSLEDQGPEGWLVAVNGHS